MTFIAGPYTATWNSQSLGTVEEGFFLNMQLSHEEIRGDFLGRSILDGVYLGGACYIDCVLEEFDLTGVQTAVFPGGADWGSVDTPGKLLSSSANPLVLTAVSGTNAIPLTLTATKAVIAPNTALRINLNSGLRKIPMRFILLPYLKTGESKYRWFETA